MNLDPIGATARRNTRGFIASLTCTAVAKMLAACVVFSLIVASASDANAAVNVVAQWRLGEEAELQKAGAAVPSIVGAAKLKSTGTVVATDASPDARGSKNAVVFDGKSYLSGPGALDASDNFGVEAFVRADTNEGFHVIVQQGSAAHGWALVRNNKGYQVLLGGVQIVGWSGDVEAGTWCHVAVVRVNGVTKFFLNGQEKGQFQGDINGAGLDATLCIGAATNGTADFFTGAIDEVRIFKLSPNGFDPADLLLNQPDVSVVPTPIIIPAAAPHTRGGDVAPADGLVASIRFDASPLEQGMTFRRDAMEPTTIAGREGWVAKQGSAQDVPWARSVLLSVTDPRFKNKQMPVCDVEVDFIQTFNAPIELRVDTERGSKNLGGSWGNSPEWKKFRISLDDAVFNSTAFGSKPSDMNTDGFDLRVNSFGGDFVIGGVRIIGYDMDKDPDYRRLLRLETVETPGELLAFEPGKSHTITYSVRNLARKALPARYELEFRNRQGDLITRESKDMTFAGRERVSIAFTFDAKTLAKGIYDLKLSIHQSNKPDAPVVLSDESYVAITDTDKLPKAQPGEFYYGLDVKLGPAYGETQLLKWMDLMGADIIRHGFGWGDDINEIIQHMPVYDEHGLAVMLMCDPPKELDAGVRAEKLPAKLAFLENTARQFPQIRFFELGNEPDLKFFYPGEIRDYVADYQVMYQAVKRGNPNAFVMNGGLSFAGAEGTERSRELVQLLDPAFVDGWAYHGHGVGVASERNAWNRMQAVADEFGKGDKVLVETESGMAARTRSQEDTQARTVVQKMVYAQSKKMPLFMWFRLLMFEEDYGSLRNHIQARPAILAYRAMVKSLRGLKFESELTSLPPGTEGYTFKDAGERRAMVIWSESATSRSLLFKMPGAANVTLRDMRGNDQTIVSENDVIKVNVGQDPVFVLAKSNQPTAQFAVVPSILSGPTDAVLIRGNNASGQLTVSVRNPFDKEMSANLNFTAPKESAVQPTNASVPVKIKAGASSEIDVPLQVSQSTTGVRWPGSWVVFAGAPFPENVSTLTSIPQSIQVDGKTIDGVRMTPDNFRIDFEKAGGKMFEKNSGLAMALVESDVDQTVRVGASADWWMAWFVNGQKVFDTLEVGNGAGYAITDHVFEVPLKKGSNVVVVQVLSGSQGWKLLIGDPTSLAKAQGANADQLVVTLQSTTGEQIDQLVIEPQLRSALSGLSQAWSQSADVWDAVDADIMLDESKVHNEFAKQPDSSKWWKGAADLSGRAWVRGDVQQLYVVIAVRDNVNVTGDSVRVSIGDTSVDVTQSDAMRVGDVTWYFVKLPRGAGVDVSKVTLQLRDADEADVLKQTAEPKAYVIGWAQRN